MDVRVLSKKKFEDSTQTTLHISNKDKSDVDIDDIRAIIDKVNVGDGTKVMCRGLNIERWQTLKGMDDEFDAESYLDYYRNRVQEEDLDKFTKFKQLQISVIRKN